MWSMSLRAWPLFCVWVCGWDDGVKRLEFPEKKEVTFKDQRSSGHQWPGHGLLKVALACL